MKAEHWWSEERHKVEIAEAYRMGWENAKEECACLAEGFEEAEFGYNPTAVKIAAAIRALKEK